MQSLRQEQFPSAGAPEQRIDAQSPQERDAYEQALREANRQGVSTQEAQQVAGFAATTVTAPHVDETQGLRQPLMRRGIETLHALLSSLL